MKVNTFSLNRKGHRIEFECTKTWILDKVEEYILSIIDETNYQNTIHRVIRTGGDPEKQIIEDWAFPINHWNIRRIEE